MRVSIDRRAQKGAFILVFLALGLGLFSFRLSVIPLLLLGGHLAFFRDPQRKAPSGESILSPADGRVAEISTQSEERYLKERAVKVGISLSLFVPHVNRAPVEGTVQYLDYRPGRFLNTLSKKSVNVNESNWIGIEASTRRVLVRQMAGAIARRICCDVRLRQQVNRGQKIGIICYGSRTELWIAERSFRPLVKVGDQVKAGETILGEWQS